MNPMTTHGAFSWVEFQGEDVTSARSFYENVLGWQIAEMPMQDNTTYPGIMVGEQPVGGFAAHSGAQGSWLPYVTVDNVDQRTRAAKDAGGEILSEPFDAPGVGRISVVRDPMGAAIAFITYEEKPEA